MQAVDLQQAPLPRRPVKVTPPGSRIVSQLGALAWAAVIIAGSLMLVIPAAVDLVVDLGIGQTAQPVPWARLESGHARRVCCWSTVKPN